MKFDPFSTYICTWGIFFASANELHVICAAAQWCDL